MHEVVGFLLISTEEHLSKALEGIFNIFRLQGADFKEFETDALSESQAVLRTHSYSVFNIYLVCNYYTHKRTTLIVLLDSLEPLSQQVECIRVCNVIDKHDQISLAKKLKGDLLEDILSGDIDQVKLYSLI